MRDPDYYYCRLSQSNWLDRRIRRMKVISKTDNTNDNREKKQDSSEQGTLDWFEELVSSSSKSREELQELVQKKMENFEGLVEYDAASILVGKDLDINLVTETDYSDSSVDIDNIVPGMSDVVLEVQIKELTGVNEFDGGKVANWIVSDDTGKTQVAFWNDAVGKIYNSFEPGDTIRVIGGYTKKSVSDYQSSRFGVPAVQIGDETTVKRVED